MNAYDWQQNLWKYIEENLYTAHKPLYLSFCDQVLDKIYADASKLPEIENGKGVNSFIHSCNHFLSPQRRSISVNQKIWQQDERGLSLAICFAIQQILAVEDMSAGSFYEPYIELMGASDMMDPGYLHKNPIGHNFEKIWKTVNAEILKRLGCEEFQITFERGSGTNKFRNYPFSQSLLSEMELNELSTCSHRERITKESTKSFILKNKSSLTKKSERKLRNSEFVSRISEQFLEYLELNSRLNTTREKLKVVAKKKCELEIVCITEGFEPDSYALLTMDQDLVAHKVTSYDQIKNSFTNGFSLFLSTHAGRWLASNIRGKSISDFRSMILGLDIRNSAGLLEPISREFNVDPVSIEFDSHIDGAEHIAFYEISFDSIKKKNRFVEEIFSFGLAESRVGKIEFEGGLLVDRRNNTYLVNYPPTGLRYSNHKLVSSEMIEVNDKKITVKDLGVKLMHVKDECIFHVSYSGSNVTIHFGKVKPDLRVDRPINWIVGDRLRLSKSLFAEDTAPSGHKPYFSHFSIFNYAVEDIIKIDSKILLLYAHIPYDLWVSFPYDGRIYDVISGTLRKRELSFWLQEFLKKILRTKQIPYPLLLNIEV